MQISLESLLADLAAIRDNRPLIHNITNLVVMNTSANALLAVGASPVMAHAEEEVADMVALAGALVINIGTLDSRWEPAMHKAMARAMALGVPIVLDPVGAGATPYRDAAVARLLETAVPSIIRGNASEIRAVLGSAGSGTKGVDSRHSSDESAPDAEALSRARGCTVCMSGATDYIAGGDVLVLVHNGHPSMTRVTGLGCAASALCGAFLAVNPSATAAAAHAMLVMGIAGEIAAELAQGPGTLQLHFLDALASMDRSALAGRMRFEIRPGTSPGGGKS
ncbi:MAG TPA: hydroxyethylthiazole kinase [Magnetospirillaceae bacterium]|nr:hydroxyethylthiazole kinase [Magnetospirillaceae bacterium]